MKNPNAVFGPMRLPFLVLAPVCIFLAIAAASHAGAMISILNVVLLLIGGVSAHISVNTLNEYFDFRSGLDLKTTKTPFSGGSGTLPALPEKVNIPLITGIISAVITAAIGIYFSSTVGWWLIPIGLLGIIIIVIYTVYLNRIPLLCLIAPGTGFGLLMVIGSYYVLTGRIDLLAIVSSIIPFFLVNNLLLLNQFPDAEADQSIGRLHYPILIGLKKSAVIYTAYLLMMYLTVILGILSALFPMWSLLIFLTLPVSIPLIKNVNTNYSVLPKLIPSLAMNVIITLISPVLVGIGLLIG
jgi:1,4-dihydroxy-2-naphthoate octaprenyltransferase